MMKRASFLFACVVIGAAFVVSPARASREVYTYRVLHPTYGDIGTYTNTVDRSGDDAQVETELKIAVRKIGIVVYRQEARRAEHWRNDRLLSFESVTVTNGTKLEVRGEARDNGFAITTPSGTQIAPGNVHPSNPWSAMVLKTDYMMSTKTGRLTHVRVSGGEEQAVALAGSTMRLHQYEIVGDKRQFVWLDGSGTPVAFRTEEEGAPVDFVLAAPQQAATVGR
jgi:Family of unknown function (DUF6134)